MFNIPTSWEGITVSQFKELFSFNEKDFENLEEYYMQILSILCDVPVSEIQELDYDFLYEAVKKISFMNTLPNKTPKPYIKTDYGDLYLNDNFYKITIGEFIDIENLIQSGYIENLNALLTIFYRQKNIKNNPFFLDTYEPYGDWIYHRAPLFDFIKINDVYGVINKYSNFRKDFFERYSGLFDDSNEDEDVNSEEENDSISKSEKMKEDEKRKNIKKWSWDVLIYRLAKNDPLKFEEATTMSLIQAFNIFSMKKELGLE